MYLNRLKQKEKENFLELAYYIANIDDDFAQEEENLIFTYRKEMELEDYEAKGIDFKQILNYFSNKNKEVKNIVFIESFALILADFSYDEEEEKFVNKMKETFAFSNKKKDELCQWVKDVIETYKKGEKLLKK